MACPHMPQSDGLSVNPFSPAIQPFPHLITPRKLIISLVLVSVIFCVGQGLEIPI